MGIRLVPKLSCSGEVFSFFFPLPVTVALLFFVSSLSLPTLTFYFLLVNPKVGRVKDNAFEVSLK